MVSESFENKESVNYFGGRFKQKDPEGTETIVFIRINFCRSE